MGLKQWYFKLRDQVRFSYAQSRYSYQPNGSMSDFDFNQMKHIVILKIDGKLGDTQVLTHFYHNLQQLPNKPLITVVCPENLVSIYSKVIGIDQVIKASRKPRAQEIKSICTRIKAASTGAGLNGEIDLVLSTEPIYRPRDFIFNYELKPKFLVGCAKAVKALSYLLYDIDNDERAMSRVFDDFMRLGNMNPSPIKYEPLYQEEALAKAQEYLGIDKVEASAGADDSEASLSCSKLVGINPVGASKSRHLSPQVTAKLMQMVLERGSESKVLLLAPRFMTEYVQAVLSRLPKSSLELMGKRLFLLPEDSSVGELGAYVACLDAMITVDTATVHLGCASNVPQLCIYHNRTSDSKRWAPITLNSQCLFVEGSLADIPEEKFLTPAQDFIDGIMQQAHKQ